MKAAACLLALAALARTADPDPEPPGSPLRELEGAWKARAVKAKGETRMYEATYTFSKGKATITTTKGKGPREMEVVPDKAVKGLIEMRPKADGRAVRYFFKVEKGELFLAPVRPGEAAPKPDFSGDNAPVLILVREKR
jgi:hypothetical protein